MLIAFSYHIVVAEDTTLFVPKKESELKNVYVDIREWGVQEWSDNPDFAQAMVKAGHSDRVKTSIASDVINGFFKGMQRK